jgi:glutathione S-transferase
LNSVEPSIQTLVVIRVSGADTDWQGPASAAARPFAERRLAQLSRALGDREWLEDRFTIGDLLMVDVLRNAPDLLTPHSNLIAYVERGTARLAFQRAVAAQLADFDRIDTSVTAAGSHSDKGSIAHPLPQEN